MTGLAGTVYFWTHSHSLSLGTVLFFPGQHELLKLPTDRGSARRSQSAAGGPTRAGCVPSRPALPLPRAGTGEWLHWLLKTAESVSCLHCVLGTEQLSQALVLGEGPEHSCFGVGPISLGSLPAPMSLAQASDPCVQGRVAGTRCLGLGTSLGTEGLLGQLGVWESLRRWPEAGRGGHRGGPASGQARARGLLSPRAALLQALPAARSVPRS